MAKIATRDAYGKALAALALENKNVVAVDADLSGSTKTAELKKVAPERHFNVGIAESNLIGVSAGLACNGKIPYCSTFAIFATGRAYDQVRNTVAYGKLNVKICATHAGLTVGEDGATHQALEDIALMRAVPNMIVIQPCDGIEVEQCIRAVADYHGPVYVRLGRSAVEVVNDNPDYKFEIGKGVVLHKGDKDIVMIASGMMVQESLKAIELLKEKGINPTLINIHTIKPLDEELIVKYAKDAKYVVSLEEHNIYGGLGGAVAECLAKHCPRKQVFIGTQDTFGESGKPELLLEKYGLSASKVAERIINECK
ncbi:MAG TPA: transketolase family protein [Erysipelotrichaceae bacterium]|nr:transketolase family protein [Erysipelotrichaceae bacterium]